MSNLPKAGAEIVLETGKFNSDFNSIIAKTGQMDEAFDSLVASAREIGGALSGIGDVDVSLTVDDSDISSLLDLEGAAFAPEINPVLDFDPIETVEAVDETSVEPGIDPALDEAPIEEVTGLDDASVQPEIDAQETAQGKEVTDKLNTLIGLQAIEIVMNVTGTILDVLNKIESFTIEPVLSLEDAVARINAQTGGLAINAEKLVSTMRYADLGDWDQIADVLIAAQQTLGPLSGDLREAATAALLVTKAFPDKQPVEILQAMTNVVRSGLSPSFSDASDLIVGGLQMGNDKGGDFLGTLEKYANVFKELGLTGDETLALINSGLDAGFINATAVAQAAKEINENLALAGGDPQAKANLALRQLGLENPKALGEEIGGEFINSVIAAIQENPGKGMSREELAESIFGTKALGTATLSAILGLDTSLDETFGMLEGRASTAAGVMEDTLRGAVDDFFLMVEQKAQEFLSSEQIDLPGKIKAIKEGLQEAIDVLVQGGTLGEAIEVGFKIQGVDEFINRFEGAMGNFVIAILETVAKLQELIPGGQTGESTRAEIARLAEGQLAFDLKIANPDEVAGMLRMAAERGVDAESIGQAAASAVEEMLKAGNVGAAQDLIDQIRIQGSGLQLAPEFNPSFGRGVGLQTALNQWIAEGNIEMINKAIEDGIVVEPDSMFDLATLQGQVDIAAAAVKDEFNTALSSGEFVTAETLAEKIGITSENFQEMFDKALAVGNVKLAETIANAMNSEDLKEQVEAAKEALGDMADQSIYSSERMNEALWSARDEAIAGYQAIAGAAQQADADIYMAVSGGSIVPEFNKMRDTALATLPAASFLMAGAGAAARVHLGLVSSWANVAVDSLMHFGDVLPILDALIAKLGQASAAASNATGAVNGVQQPTAMAEGGAFSAGEPLLFEGLGPEMVTFNRPGRVIGVNDTRALLGGGNTTNVNNNVSNNFYVQNLAQADAAGYSVARSIRGMN